MRASLIAAACLCLMTYTFAGRAFAAEPAVWVALSEPGGAYAEAAEAVRSELQRGGHVDILVRPWRELVGGSPAATPRVIVTVGLGALRGMIEADARAALLAILVPRAAYAKLVETHGRARAAASAIWLDQPLARQFALLRLTLPARNRIGMLLGPDSRGLEPELTRAAAEHGLELVVGRVGAPDQLSGATQRVLEEADVLMALPDGQVYNGATIQNILMAAYRQRVPLIGFSPAYVRAGALLSLYSTPAQAGVQAAEVVRGVLGGRSLPPPQGPRAFVIGVNADVARSLGIAIEEDAAARWTERLSREKVQ